MVQNYLYDLFLQWLLDHSAKKISVQELRQDKNQITLLDARQLREFEVSHLPGAIHVGFDLFDVNALPELEADDRIVVYCSVGYRSENVARRLIDHGYTNVWNLYGGVFEWKNAGFSVYNSEGVTDKIHAYSKAWGFWLNNAQKVCE